MTQLKRSLGVFEGITILVGITIGAGIYATPQIIAGYQSSFAQIIALWLGMGVFVYIGGLIYAELGSRLPETGGEYVYLNKAFGPFLGFIFGWAQLFIIRTSPAAGLAIVSVNYFESLLPETIILSSFSHTALCILVILLIGTINYIGIKQASIYQNLSTIIKVGGLFTLVAVGLIFIGGQENALAEVYEPTSDLGPMGRFGAVMMMIVFSYLGWDRVGYSAGEMKNPRKVIPISMFVGIGLVVMVYASANLLYHYVLGMEGVRATKTVAVAVSSELFGPIGAALIAIIVIVSATGSINGTMMTAPRVYYAMAKDGIFFKWFNYVHPKFRTPSRAIMAHCGWAIVILLVRQNFENIVAGMTFAVLIFYTMTTVALFKLRKMGVGEEGSYKVPLFPVLPAIYLLGILTLVCIRGFYEWEKSLIDLAFIAVGIPFALIFVKNKNPEIS
ncbi:MAG: amino acid permease [Bacteroidota bacterium]